MTKPEPIRVGSYNIELLSTAKLGDPNEPQLSAALEVMARVSPDIVALQELQFDVAPGEIPGVIDETNNASRLAALMNAVDKAGGYGHALIALGNSGFSWSGYDAASHDPYFGPSTITPGLFNMAIVSRFPIMTDDVMFIADLAWTDLPEHSLSELEATAGVVVPAGFPVFGSGLLVVPVDLGGQVLYVIVLHTTPPHTGDIAKHRNLDQLTALRLLIEGTLPGHELPADAAFVLTGDWNADGDHGDGFPEAIDQLLDHRLVTAFQPTGPGTVGVSPDKNTTASVCGEGDGLAAADPSTGMQFQLDYVLPSANIGTPIEGGMFYPDFMTAPEDWALACAASNHMLLWADLPVSQ